jgi:1-phosphofructokinase
MIITLTLNPAVDQTSWLERLEPGQVNRVLEAQIDPAGKGINASRVVHRLGWPTIAFGFLAGDTGNIVEKALRAERVQYHFVRTAGQTRINVTVIDSSGRATSFFGPGPPIGAEALESLDGLVQFWLRAGGVLVLAGSLPPGVPEDAYASYVRAARRAGVKVLLDADGNALRQGVRAGPDLIKPNVAEAEGLLERRLPDESAVLQAARELVARGIGIVVISMGGQGAICATRDGAWRVRPPAVERRSTVGSGDSMVAGLAVALARGDDIVVGLKLGAAAGAATAASEGTALGTPHDIAMLLPAVVIEAID